MTDVFISYSRKDKEFVQRLHEAIVAKGRDTWVDWEGIPLTADWWAEIQEGIEAANSFVFVISPDSAASKVCNQEIDHAAEHNKRIVPIVYRDTQDVPEKLTHLNWIFCRETDDFASAFKGLLAAMDTDLDWVKAHTRLTQRSVEWDKKQRNNSYLLGGDDLAEAEQLQTQTGKEPPLTELQAQFILASRQNATRRQRRLLAGVGVGLVVAIILAVVAFFQFLNAEEQRTIAETRRVAAVTSEANAEERRIAAVTSEANAEERRIVAETAEAVAEERRLEAERQTTISNARLLMAQGQNEFEDNPLLGLRLTLEGWYLAPDEIRPEMERAIQSLITTGRLQKLGNDIESVTLSTGDNHLLVNPFSRPSEVYLADTGEFLATLPKKALYPERVTSPLPYVLVTQYANETWTESGDDPPELLRLDTGETIILPEGVYIAMGERLNPGFTFSGKLPETPPYLYFHYYDGDTPAELRRTDDMTVMETVGQASWVNISPNHSYYVVTWDDAPAEIRWPGSNDRLSLFGVATGVSFSPDGTYFHVSYADETGELWLGETGELVLLTDPLVEDVDFSPDSTTVVIDYSNGPDELRRLDDGQIITRFDREILSVDFSSDGSIVRVYFEDDTETYLWADNGQPVVALDQATDVYMTEIDPHILVTYADAPDEVWFNNGQEVLHLDAEASFVRGQEDYLFISYTSRGLPAELRILDNLEEGVTLNGATTWFGYSGTARYFVVTYRDETTEIWNGLSGRRLINLGIGAQPEVSSRPRIGFAADDTRLVVWYTDGRTYLLDISWLDAISQLGRSPSPDELLELACWPFRQPNAFDESELFNYLPQGQQLQACQ